MAEETKRRPGRPSKGKRGTFTFRVTEVLRDHLEKAAADAGRSVSEEIERLLEHAVSQERFSRDPQTAELVRRFITSIELVRSFTGHEWNSDERARCALAASFAHLTKWMLEKQEPTMTLGMFGELANKGLENLSADELGWLVAFFIASPHPLFNTAVAHGFFNLVKERANK